MDQSAIKVAKFVQKSHFSTKVFHLIVVHRHEVELCTAMGLYEGNRDGANPIIAKREYCTMFVSKLVLTVTGLMKLSLHEFLIERRCSTGL